MIKGVNIKDRLVEQVAKELQHPEEWVDKVITYQFKNAAEAIKLHNEIEISGFGKFLQSQSKIKRRIAKNEIVKSKVEQKMLSLSGKEYEQWQKKLEGLSSELQYYYQRLK